MQQTPISILAFLNLTYHLPSAASPRSRPIDCCTASRKSDAAASCASLPEHRRIPIADVNPEVSFLKGHPWTGFCGDLPQHVWHYEEPHVAAPDVDLIKM